jgi:hypothetical protein
MLALTPSPGERPRRAVAYACEGEHDTAPTRDGCRFELVARRTSRTLELVCPDRADKLRKERAITRLTTMRLSYCSAKRLSRGLL